MPTRKSGGGSTGGLGVAGGGTNLQTIILGAITIVLALIGLGIAIDTIAPYLTGGASALNWTRYPGGESMLKLFPLIMMIGLIVFGALLVWLGTQGKALGIKSTVFTVIVVVVAVISKMVPLRGNPKMRSRLIQGNLNLAADTGNPELSGEILNVQRLYTCYPQKGNEIVRYSGESRRNKCLLPIVMDAADTVYDNANTSSFTGLTSFLGLIPLLYTVGLMAISGLLGFKGVKGAMGD